MRQHQQIIIFPSIHPTLSSLPGSRPRVLTLDSQPGMAGQARAVQSLCSVCTLQLIYCEMHFCCKPFVEPSGFIEVYSQDQKTRQGLSLRQGKDSPTSPRNPVNDTSAQKTASPRSLRKSPTLEAERQLFHICSPFTVMEVSHSQMGRVLLGESPLVGKDCVYKMIKRSNYQQLLQKYGGGGEKWIDPDFKQVPFQTIRGERIDLTWEGLDVVSKRAGKAVVFIDKYIEPTDIVQSDKLGDCYFLSAIAGLAAKAGRIVRLFGSIQVGDGVFMARMMWKGILQEVVVDQFFPFYSKTQQLFGCRPCRSQSEIYVMVLEKCWAKLWHSYEEIDGGFPHQALRALSGALTKNYYFTTETATPEAGSAFFKQLSQFSQKEYVMCTGTNTKGRVRIIHKVMGEITIEIEKDHIYCVQRVCQENGERMVRIYNPWGHNKQAGTGKYVCGEIKIKWAEFIKNFYYITVCKVLDRANYLYIEMQNCKNERFKFISFTAQSKGYYGITVSETDRKQSHHSGWQRYICVTFIVLHKEGGQYSLHGMKTSQEYSDHYLQLNDLSAGEYLIAIYFTEVAIKESLTFSVYSEERFGFEEIHMDRPFQDHLLSLVLLSHNKRSGKAAITRYLTPSIWISFHTLVHGTVFGYYLVHVDSDSEVGFSVQMSRKQFTDINLRPLPPYDTDLIQLTARPGHETIMVIVTIDHSTFQQQDSKYMFNTQRHLIQDLSFGESYPK